MIALYLTDTKKIKDPIFLGLGHFELLYMDQQGEKTQQTTMGPITPSCGTICRKGQISGGHLLEVLSDGDFFLIISLVVLGSILTCPSKWTGGRPNSQTLQIPGIYKKPGPPTFIYTGPGPPTPLHHALAQMEPLWQPAAAWHNTLWKWSSDSGYFLFSAWALQQAKVGVWKWAWVRQCMSSTCTSYHTNPFLGLASGSGGRHCLYAWEGDVCE